MTKILITGANGQLGSEIKEITGQFPELDFLFTDIDELDITNQTEVAKLLSEYGPDYLINSAAHTAVDKAETDLQNAELINATAVSILAEETAKTDCKFIHLSTDYVFDGKGTKPIKEDAKVNPQTVYGKTKLQG